jgi:hypothetical protein
LHQFYCDSLRIMVIVTLPRCDLRDGFAMADEAFALSPISARAELPSEADYDAIREAFMETARGRWFLGEYGKRNRNADTSMVLDAVARIEATIVAAQKPAPINELPDALVLIRGLLSDAKASAAQTMSGPDAELALAAVNKAMRIIREIAWTLREYGTDTRICDMLDAQVNAIETGHQHTIAPEKRDAVLATFDLLIRRIGELGGSALSSSPDFETASSPPSSAGDEADAATAETEAAATPPLETASEATARAAVGVAATADKIDAAVQDSSAQDISAQDTTAQDATNQYARTREFAVDDATAQDLSAKDISVQDTTGQDTTDQNVPAENLQAEDTTAYDTSQAVPLLSEGSVAGVTTASAEFAPAEVPEPEVAGAASVEAAALDLEIAQDMAILDAIALEMAEPDLAGQDLAGQDPAESQQVVEPDRGERGPIESATNESGAVTLASEISIAPAPEPEEPSLGATLIASGIFKSRSAATDALAPFRRMSQAERIAFFS